MSSSDNRLSGWVSANSQMYVFLLSVLSYLLVLWIPLIQGLQMGPLSRPLREAHWDLAAPETLASLRGGNSHE